MSSCTSVFPATVAKDSTASLASKISTKSINYLRSETIIFPSLDKLDITADLYLDTQLPITEISYRVGFNDITHFTRTFKTHVDLLPSKYREKAFK